MVVLFDLDETLLDHRTTERAAATALHRIADLKRPVDEFVAAWAAALERHFQRYLDGELSYEEQRRARVREAIDPRLTDEAVDRLLEQYLAAYLSTPALFTDAVPCLDRLSAAGHRLGVITNGNTEHQRLKLTHSGILARFECVVVSEECGHAKPAPEIFARACAHMGEPAARAIYIGDRYDVDAEGARRAGLRGIWLDRRATAGAEHLPPIIASLDDLDALLQDAT